MLQSQGAAPGVTVSGRNKKGNPDRQDCHHRCGARDRERSGDLVFFRHALYQLSYPGVRLVDVRLFQQAPVRFRGGR